MEIRLLRLPEVIRAVGLRRSAIYARVAAGTFPAPVSIGARSVAWVSDDVAKWIDAQVKASRNDT
jgi:prophage regulatory protein